MILSNPCWQTEMFTFIEMFTFLWATCHVPANSKRQWHDKHGSAQD